MQFDEEGIERPPDIDAPDWTEASGLVLEVHDPIGLDSLIGPFDRNGREVVALVRRLRSETDSERTRSAPLISYRVRLLFAPT